MEVWSGRVGNWHRDAVALRSQRPPVEPPTVLPHTAHRRPSRDQPSDTAIAAAGRSRTQPDPQRGGPAAPLEHEFVLADCPAHQPPRQICQTTQGTSTHSTRTSASSSKRKQDGEHEPMPSTETSCAPVSFWMPGTWPFFCRLRIDIRAAGVRSRSPPTGTPTISSMQSTQVSNYVCRSKVSCSLATDTRPAMSLAGT